MRKSPILVMIVVLAGMILASSREAPARQSSHSSQTDTPNSYSFSKSLTAARLSSKGTEADPGTPAAGDFSGTTAPIRIYQQFFSDLRGRGCQFQPSCSEYSKVAIRKHGLLIGSALAADRLNRCNSGARKFYKKTPSGRLSDPVPGTAKGAHVGRAVPGWLLPSSRAYRGTYTFPSDTLSAPQQDILRFAFDLLEEGDYFRAVTEFKRLGSSSEYASVKALTRFYVAESLFASGDWETALSEYAGVRDGYPNTRLSHQAGFMTGVSLFNLGDYSGCRTEMKTFAGEGTADDLSDEAYFISGLSYLEEGRWRLGSAVFDEALSLPGLQKSPYPFELMSRESLRGEKLPGRSRFFAALMSAVLPGAGQMYSGRFWDGVRALTVNGLLIFSTYRLVDDEHYAGAYLLAGITVPFYVGNILGARESAGDYDRRQRAKFVDSLVLRSKQSSSRSQTGAVSNE